MFTTPYYTQEQVSEKKLKLIGSNRKSSRIPQIPQASYQLRTYDGILVPGGFGKRGSEGIINTANFARLENIPYLGICFGFQLAIVAVLRNLCLIENANSTELDPDTKDPVK